MTSLKQRFADLRPRIDDITVAALDEAIASFGTPDAGTEFFNAARTAIRGGKRFRALLVQLGASITRDMPLGEVLLPDLGAALELYQASALVHDDIIDHALTRRGVTTTHVAFTGRHAKRQWAGSSTEYGTAVGLLAGDLLFSAAERAAAAQCSSLSPARAGALMRVYSRMHAEVAYGQYLDITAEQMPLNPANDLAIDVRNAQEVILHKSARYSIVHPALLGAIAAGAADELLDALDEALTPWGIAFQLRDDELGVFGDPAVTGKSAGEDIREGKRTVLLGLTWERATAGEREALSHIVGRPHLTNADVNRARDIIEERGRAEHEALIDTLVAQGDAALATRVFSESTRAELSGLADIIVKRSS